MIKRRRKIRVRRERRNTTIRYYYSYYQMRRVRKDNVQEKTEKKVTYINKEEEDLCRYLNMTFKQFASMKERILKESVRIGLIKSQDIMILFE